MSKTYDLKLKSIKLVNTPLDRRRKLTDEEREHIKELHKKGESTHSIARMYKGKCSRRLIQFIIHPERLKAMQEKHAKEQHWKTYYDRKKLSQAKKNWAHYKINLYKKNI